jgi:uncharacterized protein (TIGR04168 family)
MDVLYHTARPNNPLSGAQMQLAIIGDIHGAWTDADTAHFNADDALTGLLFVGDLPARTRHAEAEAIARKLSALRRPAWLIPGNHDATSFPRMVLEILGMPTGGVLAQADRVAALARALSPVHLVGYSAHDLHDPQTDSHVTMIAARPHAMGGGLSFAPYLRHAFQINTLADSAARLRALIDAATHPRLIFLAHNGPTGLGAHPCDPWGCDFKPGGGDWGDPDLRDAITYARSLGRHVLAVIAGHMHHRTRQGHTRPWLTTDADPLYDTLYINAARCPRIFKRADASTAHHHIRLSIPARGPCSAREVLLNLS